MEAGIVAGKNMFGNLSRKEQGFEAPPVEAPSQSCPASDVVAEIKKYKELFDIGAITEEEFEAKKKQLLN